MNPEQKKKLSPEQLQYFRELDRLILLLERAHRFIHGNKHAVQKSELVSFAGKLEVEIRKLKFNDTQSIDLIWGWFVPLGDWEDLTKQPGTGLGHLVFTQVRKLQQAIAELGEKQLPKSV